MPITITWVFSAWISFKIKISNNGTKDTFGATQGKLDFPCGVKLIYPNDHRWWGILFISETNGNGLTKSRLITSGDRQHVCLTDIMKKPFTSHNMRTTFTYWATKYFTTEPCIAHHTYVMYTTYGSDWSKINLCSKLIFTKTKNWKKTNFIKNWLMNKKTGRLKRILTHI